MFILEKQYRNLFGIYYIHNVTTDKMYIGKCSDSRGLQTRLLHHYNALKRGDHFNYKLQRDFNNYGKDSFKIGILQLCEREDTLLFEQEWLSKAFIFSDKYYNYTFVAEGKMCITEEAKQHLSKINTGKTYGDETKKRISEVQRGKWRKDCPTGFTNVRANGNKFRFIINRYNTRWEYGGYTTPEEAYKDSQYCLTLSDEELTEWIEAKRKVRKTKQSSKYKGVSFCKHKQKYNAYCDNNGKRKSLGYHDTEELAYQKILDYKESLVVM